MLDCRKKLSLSLNAMFIMVPPVDSYLWDTLVKGPGSVVSAAVIINLANFGVKSFAFFVTGSHSLFAESVHSLADTLNQLILAWGLILARRKPDSTHPYGYSNFRYISSLISGVGIFGLGTGMSYYHGATALWNPHELDILPWAFGLLAGSFISESVTLAMAYRELRRRAQQANVSLFQYIKGGEEPSLAVIFLEDLAAVTGVAIAALCMGLSKIYGSAYPDAIGSLLIGTLLGGVAFSIIRASSDHLVGRSMSDRKRDSIIELLKSDPMVASVHDVKAIRQGMNEDRIKAEVKFDGKNVARSYLSDAYGANLEKSLLPEIQSIKSSDDALQFMLKHGEKIVMKQGEEIDRMEKDIMKRHPSVRHIDLEPM